VIAFASQPGWEAWLEANRATAAGVWLKIAKKGCPTATVSYSEAVESALCHGWIDGQKGAHDDQFWLQRFTARGSRSKWSRINRDKATELLAAGRMRPAGIARIEQAREDGSWDAAYEPQSSAAVPDDLQRELDRNPEASAFFAALDRGNRYAILYRIEEAKRPETRARRIATYVAMLGERQKLHP